jgi:hypothetical protein
VQLQFAPSLIRGAIYEVYLHEDFDDLPAALSFESVSALQYPVAASDASSDASVYTAKMRIGECAVRRNPSSAKSLIDSPIGSDEETAAIKAIIPALSVCTFEGQTLTLSKSIVRGMIAEVLYRLLAAKRGLDHAQG